MTESVVAAASAIARTYLLGDTEVGLWDATFDVRVGEMLAIVGRSGSGKSTLMNLLGLLDTPSQGELRLFGVDASGLSPTDRAGVRAARIGFVFQSFHLAPRRSVAENVSSGLIFSCPRAERHARVVRALESVDLADRMGQRVDKLSGGERQRVALARALAKDPGLLLADEPTGNLDRRNGEAVVELLRATAEAGAAVVVVTHDLELASHADRTLEMTDGRLV